MTTEKAKKTKSYILEFGQAIRLEVNDGVPTLYSKDTYMEQQDQDPWDVVAQGDEVYELVRELQAFLDEHGPRRASNVTTRGPTS